MSQDKAGIVRQLRGNRWMLLTSALSSFYLFPLAAYAQIDEIVVTAQKRSESVQDVPVTISAFSEEKLDRTGFDALEDLAALTPGLQFGNYGSVSFVNLRGIGNENTTAGGDPGVALHYDGVYVGRPVGTLFSAFDSERVEILKGPQGTLYGRNATGGSINYISKKPGEKFGGEADVTIGDYNWVRTRVAINIPINETVSTRFVGFFEDRDGYQDNPFPGGTKANDAENWGIRSHVNFDWDSASLLLSGTYIEAGGVGSKSELREAYPGTTTVPVTPIAGPPGFAFTPGGPTSGVPASNRFVDGNGNTVFNDLYPFSEAQDFPESQDNDFLILSATLDYDLGPVSIRSITGYVETNYLTRQDNDNSILDLAELRLAENSDQFSQELQILSNSESALEWIIGGYYFNENADRRSQFFRGRYDVFAANFGVESGFEVGGTVETTSWAVFGQATYALSDAVNITGGLRYSEDKKEGINEGQQFNVGYSVPVGDTFDDITYRLAVHWKVTDDTLLFGSFSTGYKSGGINQVTNATLDPSAAIYGPETVEAFEVGLKSTLFDGRLQLNTALFHNTYSDQQFQVFGPAGPEAFNADGSVVKGVEVEVQGNLADWLGFDAGAGYTDSKFDDQVIDGVNIGGNQVQRTPEWTFNVGVTAEKSLGEKGDMALRVDYAYTDEIFYSALNRTGGFADPGGSDLAGSYSNVNARLFWYSPNEKWIVELAATNLFDTVQEGNVFRGIGFHDVGGHGGQEAVTYNPPRQISGRIGLKF